MTRNVSKKEIDKAFKAVGFRAPEDDVLPLSRDLTPSQRVLFERLSEREGKGELDLARFGVPNVRLREWLGLARPGALERRVTFTFERKKLEEPLWRALRRFETAGDAKATAAFVKSLPMATRLEAFGEVNSYGREKPYRLQAETLFDWRDAKLLGKLGDEAASWAPRFADWLMFRVPKDERGGDEVKWPVFLGLVRAKVRIEPRWDALLPLGSGAHEKLTEECIRAIPRDRRDQAIVNALTTAETGLPLLAKFPSTVLVQKILACKPKKRELDEMKKIGKKHEAVAAALAEHAPTKKKKSAK